MEIKDYLRAVRSRLWLPVLVPVVAAGATVGVIYKQPTQYSATATVIVPALSAKGYSTSAVTQYFSTYKDVLTSQPVVQQVTKATGAKSTDVTKCTAATISASSNIIQVTCTATNKDLVVPMTQAASLDALDALLQPALSAAQSDVNTAQSAVDQANTAIQQFTQSSGALLPDEDYRLQQQELQSLITQLEEAKLSNDTARASGLQTIIAERQQQLATLADQVTRYQELTDSKTSALSVLNRAQGDLNTVKAEIASDHAPGSVVVKDNGRESKVGNIIKFGGIAFAVAFLLCLGAIAMLELMRPAGRLAPVAAGGDVMPSTLEVPADGSHIGETADDTAAVR